MYIYLKLKRYNMSYWKILSKKERFYHVGPKGWEIYVKKVVDTNYRTGKTTTKMQIQWFKGPNAQDRKELKNIMAMEKRIAKVVNTKEEYEALWRRIDPEDWDFIVKNDLNGENLINWAYNTPTSQEYYNLLRYN